MPKTRIQYQDGKKYVITAPNQDYTGKTEGLEISKGRGVIDGDVFRNLADPERGPAETLERIQTNSPEYKIEEVAQRVYTMPDTSALRTEDGRLRTKADKAKAAKAKADPETE